jgi:predicted RNA-binding Zn-ribbon protein involved in translation (DUF1610 family)
MQPSLPQTALHCTQCGGELHPDEGQLFLTCPYCSSTVYLDKSRVVFHWYLAPTLDEAQARAALSRWMASSQTVKDLDRKSTVTGTAFEYFPVWYFKRRSPGGQEEIVLEPASATSVSEIRHVKLPAGDLRKYDESLDAQAHPPSVPLDTALGWLAEHGVPQAEIIEQALVHIPLYTFKYTFQGKPFTALVEAATSGVFANIYPAKAETPYRTVGCIAAAVFLCLATFPIIGYASAGGAEGAGLGLLACASLGLLAAPILFALAAYVAAKI